MSDPIAVPPPPAVVEVVPAKVAEQLMSDMYRRIAELEARLEVVEREASESDRFAETAEPAFVEVARQLLQRAGDLRTSAGTVAEPVVEPPTTTAGRPKDEHGH